MNGWIINYRIHSILTGELFWSSQQITTEGHSRSNKIGFFFSYAGIHWKITYNWFKTLQCDRLPASPCGHVSCFFGLNSSSINKTSINHQGSDFLLTFFNPVWWKTLKNQSSQFIPLPPWRGVPGSDALRRATIVVSFLAPEKAGEPISLSL